MGFRIATYESIHFEGVDALRRGAFPNDAPRNSAAVAIPEKISFQSDLMLVAIDGEKVIGSVMAGYEGHRGWISRVAVLGSHRSMGVGGSVLAEAERRLVALGCIKVNPQVAEDNFGVVKFYERAGYTVEPRISMSKPLADIVSRRSCMA
jgi:ribosomal protein S18 acetylase RimI-like enzyme